MIEEFAKGGIQEGYGGDLNVLMGTVIQDALCFIVLKPLKFTCFCSIRRCQLTVWSVVNVFHGLVRFFIPRSFQSDYIGGWQGWHLNNDVYARHDKLA
jgi:hypothetical protein